MRSLFDDRTNIRKETLELEVSQRTLALKITKKELTKSRLSQLVDEADHCTVLSRAPMLACACSARYYCVLLSPFLHQQHP